MSKTDGMTGGGHNSPAGPHRLRLYVAGSGPQSLHAVQCVKRMCESELSGRYQLEVVDIYKELRRAMDDQIVAIPTLIKQGPGESRRIAGDLSNADLLKQELDL